MLNKWASIMMFGIGTLFGVHAIGVLIGVPAPPGLVFCGLILASVVMMVEGLKEARRTGVMKEKSMDEITEKVEVEVGGNEKVEKEEQISEVEIDEKTKEIMDSTKQDVENKNDLADGNKINQKKTVYRLARITGTKRFKGKLKNKEKGI